MSRGDWIWTSELLLSTQGNTPTYKKNHSTQGKHWQSLLA